MYGSKLNGIDPWSRTLNRITEEKNTERNQV